MSQTQDAINKPKTLKPKAESKSNYKSKNEQKTQKDAVKITIPTAKTQKDNNDQIGIVTDESGTYRQLDEIEHVFAVCDMYGGSDEATERTTSVLSHISPVVNHQLSSQNIINIENNTINANKSDDIHESHHQEDAEYHQVDDERFAFKNTLVTIPRLAEQCFREILINCGDNADRSRKSGVEVGIVSVTVSGGQVSVENGGLGIAVLRNVQSGVLNPEMIFGKLRTSSHYGEEDRTSAGRNGYGAKLTNIFSSVFEVEVDDPRNGVAYSQRWSGNSRRVEPPRLEPCESHRSSRVKVTWTLDFNRLKWGKCNEINEEMKYSDADIDLFRRHCAELSMSASVPVKFNGEWIGTSDALHLCVNLPASPENTPRPISLDDYVTLRAGRDTKRFIFECSSVGSDQWHARLALVDGEEGGLVSASFVNGLASEEGGTHVSAFLDAAIKTLAKLEGVNIALPKTAPQNTTSSTSATAIVENSATKQAQNTTLRPQDVSRKINYVVEVRVRGPKWTGQTKGRLDSPTFEFVFPPKAELELDDWKLTETLRASMRAKERKQFERSDGRMTAHVKISKGEDANLAGTRQGASQCALFLIEGKSASSYIKSLIAGLPHGKDLNGYYPMLGKPPNVDRVSAAQMAENKEFCEIKRLLGLRDGIVYSKESGNRAKLRYQRGVILVPDSDVDGDHIQGLLVLLFARFWPSLIDGEYLRVLRTPVARATFGANNSLSFYRDSDLQTWLSSFSAAQSSNTATSVKTPANLKVKYLKGLGSSSRADVAEDLRASQYQLVCYDNERSCSEAALRVAFHPQACETRKRWVLERRALAFEEDNRGNQNFIKTNNKSDSLDSSVMEFGMTAAALRRDLLISEIVNQGVAAFAWANVVRAVPLFCDTLKQIQRQIAAFLPTHWGANFERRIGTTRVSILGSQIAASCAYEHGDKNIADAIATMALDFPGSNNLPWFVQDGGFGTRCELGADASQPRYTYTKPEWWLKHVFSAEDQPLLHKMMRSGAQAEPEFLLSLFPVGLVNGVSGIGTGFSSHVPNFSPNFVCDWLRAKLEGDQLKASTISKEAKPWYRGFTGQIETVENVTQEELNTNKHSNNDVPPELRDEADELNAEFNPNFSLGESNNAENECAPISQSKRQNQTFSSPRFKVTGSFRVLDNDEEVWDKFGDEFTQKQKTKSHLSRLLDGSGGRVRVLITELPIGRSQLKYRRWLEHLRDDEKSIDECYDRCTPDSIRFLIEGWRHAGGKVNHHTLRLECVVGCGNMVFVDPNHRTVIKFSSVGQLLDSWFEWRMPHYQARRDLLLSAASSKMQRAQQRRKFVSLVAGLEDKANVTEEEEVGGVKRGAKILPEFRVGAPRAQLESAMVARGLPLDLMKKICCDEATAEGVADSVAAETVSLSEFHSAERQTATSLWLEDLDAFCLANEAFLQQKLNTSTSMTKTRMPMNVDGTQRNGQTFRSAGNKQVKKPEKRERVPQAQAKVIVELENAENIENIENTENIENIEPEAKRVRQ